MLRLVYGQANNNSNDLVRRQLERLKDWSYWRNGRKKRSREKDSRRVSTPMLQMMKIGMPGMWKKMTVMIQGAGSMSRAMMKSTLVTARMRSRRQRKVDLMLMSQQATIKRTRQKKMESKTPRNRNRTSPRPEF